MEKKAGNCLISPVFVIVCGVGTCSVPMVSGRSVLLGWWWWWWRRRRRGGFSCGGRGGGERRGDHSGMLTGSHGREATALLHPPSVL